MKVYVAIWTYGEKTSEVLGVFSTEVRAERKVSIRKEGRSGYGSVKEHNLDITSEDVIKQEKELCLSLQIDYSKPSEEKTDNVYIL